MPFWKCPQCGGVETERRTTCACGYREAAGTGPKPTPLKGPFPYQAAHYCALLSIGALFATIIGPCCMGTQPHAGSAAGFMALVALLLAGSATFGAIALLGLARHGPGGILLKTIFGLGLSVAIIAWWGMALLAVLARD